MSDSSAEKPRPISLLTVITMGIGFSLFALCLRWSGLPGSIPAPQNLAAEKLSDDAKWRATPATRHDTLVALKEAQAKQGASYAMLDKAKGTVQLPIDRAMQLVVQENSARK